MLADVKSNKVVVPPMKIADVPVADPRSGIDYRSYKIQFQAPQNVGLFTWKVFVVSDTFVGDEASRDVILKIDDPSVLNADDANAGWGKVWRSACWARLNNTERAHFELRYAIDENFVSNGFSMYTGTSTPFQIDANYGLGGAILSMLVVDLPAAVGDTGVKTVVLGPAIPEAWGEGNVQGLRLRGGGVVDFEWDAKGLVTKAQVSERKERVRIVNKEDTVLVEV